MIDFDGPLPPLPGSRPSDFARYEAAMFNVRDGILRFLDRPENDSLKASFTENPSWAVFQQGIDELLMEKMDVINWLKPCLARWSEQEGDVSVWDDALYQVCTLLCQPEETDS